ncbi:helix-turn-helix domain-containing protein [Salinisphaera orenii]|uniref:helix-turn-helix domain-containing protein n=1 Tax=Salinisphaera orenii TaxID=856731 RepID=UPI000F48C812|nr:helix-turn-helix transcriptional regulator [Salinisphaera halophila]
MTKRTTSKKPARGDWHPADIKAALEKAGWSLRRLSVHHGLGAQSLQKCLHQPWPRAERLVAAAIGRQPRQVWPSRYHADGTPKRGRSPKYTNCGAPSPADAQESAA